MDLHGADGHVPRQILQAGDREGSDYPRGHPGKDSRLGEFAAAFAINVQPSMFNVFCVTHFLFEVLFLQIVKALEHLHNNLQVIHRGET